ncbi:hypothetical protein RZS08_05955, partial [Arthrospira platensis SPKY1]|nr:hypothetical protein [Arthrospira platensis SPKY1]
MAALSAETIEERLKADGKIPDRRKVEMWLTQAAALAQTAATPESEPVPIAEPQNRTEIRRPLNSGNGWQESAQFVVYIESRQRDGRTELQTTAHHIEGNAYHTWPGIAHRELCQWIVEQIENVVEEPADLSQEVPARTRHTRVEIEKFRLRQPARVIQLVDKSASQALPAQTIKNAEDSIFEVEFALSGEGAAHLVEQQPAYRAKTY